MPNHVVNEIIFRVDAEKQSAIVSKLCRPDGTVDFELLVPSPINIWPGSVAEVHEKTFPDTHLDWARKNWGTKWNAYSQKPIERTDEALILRFETAWRPPYGWLVAVFNTFKISFEHNWMSEGDSQGVCGVWNYARLDDFGGEAWKETKAEGEMQRHLHKLQWGVEEFPDEEKTEA